MYKPNIIHTFDRPRAILVQASHQPPIVGNGEFQAISGLLERKLELAQCVEHLTGRMTFKWKRHGFK